MKKLILFTSIFLSACAANGGKTIESSEYTFKYYDDPQNNVINLFIESNSSSNICVQHGYWPSLNGRINDAANGYADLEIDGNVYKKEYDIGEYCPKCETKIKPHGVLKGYLSYKDYNLPADKKASKKNLRMSPLVTKCTGEK